ncbi:Imm72 family immunity protein [Paraburkholderia sp. BCC1884]|uniref:Imm72 family immunity protein n=1 Tax=Paraburkholderia sp. BCC1884 TaxID=2562668 RepID=UPI00118333F8|nr:Imm72 family immunity protein [Paraburkholderia sp. BCC1884]
MQDQETRRRVFWLLKRLTSYSLWERKRDAWQAFAAAYENAVQIWPESQPEQMDADRLPRIFETLSAFNKGLDQLRSGHRFVWRTGEPLQVAVVNSGAIASFLYPHPDYWERGAQFAPYPDKVETLHRLLLASQYEGEYAPIEVPFVAHMAARYSSAGGLLNQDAYRYQFYELPYPVFPDVLPPLPAATDIVISSGRCVPVDGIWEPIKIEREKLFGIVPIGVKSTENNGCFNYLVMGTKAPNIVGDWNQAVSKADRIGTHWRLLWEDTRYRNGVIPDESGYFLAPKESYEEAAKEQPVGEVEVRTGEVCPVSGTWEAKGFHTHRVELSKGKVMPDVLANVPGSGERRVHWVTWRLIKRV